MSKIKNGSITIFEALKNIKEGKYIMPAFQRQYVWDMGRIEKLWDSILLDYPISNFLFWHVDNNNVTWDTYFCKFLSNICFDNSKNPKTANYDIGSIDLGKSDTAILDGQQRLTTLLVTLYGECRILQKNGRKIENSIVSELYVELNKNNLSSEESYNENQYNIKFITKIGEISPSQFKIKKILDDKFTNDLLRETAIEDSIANVPENSKEYGRNLLNHIYNKIFVEKLITYTDITEMKQDDALEMFIRFNSGAKPLQKSEITMAIFGAYWPNARFEFGKVLQGKYSCFGTDFIIRTSLMLFGDVVKTVFNKEVAEKLKNNWSKFKETLVNLDNFLFNHRINISDFGSSWNVLLPIIYFMYNNDIYLNYSKDIMSYLTRAILFKYFQSGTTSKLLKIRNYMIKFTNKITIEMLDQIEELAMLDSRIEEILNSEKGSKVASEALHYLSLEWSNKTYKYEVDHLHPYTGFDNGKPFEVSNSEWNDWKIMRNKLPNLWLLEGRENASKNDMTLFDYYNDKTDVQQVEFNLKAVIPSGISLDLNKFSEFYEARKKILAAKIQDLLLGEL